MSSNTNTNQNIPKSNGLNNNSKQYKTWPLIVLALAFGGATAIGVRLREASFMDTLTVFVLYTLASGALLFALLKLLNRPCASLCSGDNNTASSSFIPTRKTVLILFLVALVPFLLMLLANYPGVGTLDSSDSIKQSLGMLPWANATTFVYTCLVMPFACLGNALGNLSFGIFLYSLVQCTCMAATVTYTAFWFIQKGAPRWLVIAIFCFYVLNPIVLRYAISMWKDVPFSMTILLYLLTLADVAFSKGKILESKGGLARLIVFTLLVGMLRGNGIYVVVFCTIVLAIVYKKRVRKIVLSVGCFVAAVSIIVTGPLYTALGITPPPFRESTGILIQQVGCTVYNDGVISDEDQQTFENVMSLDYWAADYTPQCSDGLKYGGHFNDEWFNAHKIEFLNAWFNTGLHNIGSYIKAWLVSTQGYWDISPSSAKRWVCQDGITMLNDETGTNYLAQITGIAWLESDFADNAELRSLPLLYPLFNLASMFWIVAACAALWLCQRKKELLTVVAPLLAVWLTLMIAAPDYCQFRYMFSFHLCLPVVVALLFYDYWGCRNDKEDSLHPQTCIKFVN